MKKTFYNQTYPALSEIKDVECWNRTDGSTGTIPAGTPVLVCHAYDSSHTTVQIENGLPLNGDDKDIGYRFIVKNVVLNKALNIKLPVKTFDLVGNIIAHETGNLSEKKTNKLLGVLKKSGIGAKLQGRYSSVCS